MLCFPITTSNRNVPKDACLINEYSQMSGEIINTTFADRHGILRQVCDWVDAKPHLVDPLDIAIEMDIDPITIYRAIVAHFDSRQPADFIGKATPSEQPDSPAPQKRKA
jgi:hypothetical protein